jgi:hypothetical protein
LTRAFPTDHSHRFVILTGILFLNIFFGCNGDPISVSEPQSPEIRAILAPARAFLDPADTITVHVHVIDPQGVPDIAAVTLFGQMPESGGTFMLDMRDDGLDGDIIAKDGQFVVKIVGSMWQKTGTGLLSATALDKSENRVGGDTLTIDIIAGTRGSAPVIESVIFPNTVNIDSTFQIMLLARVFDTDGSDNIDSVEYRVFPPSFPVPAFTGFLLDNGISDDGIAGNGIFGAMFANQSLGTATGLYTLRVQAFDKAGNESRAVTRVFVVESDLDNRPPQIVSVAAPDTISRSSTGPFVLRAVARDANGPGDISRVFFNTFRPDGTPSSGNPFFMKDDGVKDNNGLGDNVANDGEYALVIEITTANATGSYRFEFQAEDRAGLLSEKFVHTIVVVE